MPFSVTGGDWQEISVDIPAAGPLGILRVYLPPTGKRVEIDWMELTADKKSRRWDF